MGCSAKQNKQEIYIGRGPVQSNWPSFVLGYSADYYPEYFGAIPAPVMMPRRYVMRYITLSDGIFALETDTGVRLIAVAGIIWCAELQETTARLGIKVEALLEAEVPVEVQYLFFLEKNGCLALFELLPVHPGLLDSARLDKLALMNAIWSFHPDYALAHNFREQQGLNDMLGLILRSVGAECELSGSVKNMVAHSPETGTEYIRWRAALIRLSYRARFSIEN